MDVTPGSTIYVLDRHYAAASRKVSELRDFCSHVPDVKWIAVSVHTFEHDLRGKKGVTLFVSDGWAAEADPQRARLIDDQMAMGQAAAGWVLYRELPEASSLEPQGPLVTRVGHFILGL